MGSDTNLSKSPPNDTSTPRNSPIFQPSQGRENSLDDYDDDDEDSVVPVVGEEEDESSSTVNQSLPWRVIETAKKRLKDSGFLERVRCCFYVSRTRVFWSFTLICGFSLVVETITRREAEISASSARRER